MVISSTPTGKSRVFVQIQMDDLPADVELRGGTGGVAAIYTDRGRPVHVISKVVVRIQAWMNYLL